MFDFDTLKYSRRLEESGVAPERAEAHTEALAGAVVTVGLPLLAMMLGLDKPVLALFRRRGVN